jgi:hypothetical protein
MLSYHISASVGKAIQIWIHQIISKLVAAAYSISLEAVATVEKEVFHYTTDLYGKTVPNVTFPFLVISPDFSTSANKHIHE